MRLARLEHALLPRLRLEHALLRCLRLGGARFGAAEFQPVEEAPAAFELARGGGGIVCAPGFFRPRRCATNLLLLLEGDAANISGPGVKQRALLARGADFARSRRRRLRRRR